MTLSVKDPRKVTTADIIPDVEQKPNEIHQTSYLYNNTMKKLDMEFLLILEKLVSEEEIRKEKEDWRKACTLYQLFLLYIIRKSFLQCRYNGRKNDFDFVAFTLDIETDTGVY